MHAAMQVATSIDHIPISQARNWSIRLASTLSSAAAMTLSANMQKTVPTEKSPGAGDETW
jgi:hypothetical protein